MTAVDVGAAAFEELLSRGDRAVLELGDGRFVPMPTAGWHGDPRRADLSLLDRCRGPALDVGCGPGRLTAALIGRGIIALGVDTSAHAVRLTADRGGVALRRSIFERLPGEHRWGTVLLADGNIGIGGNPRRLLVRCRDLLTDDSRVLAELVAEPSYDGPVRLHHGGRRSQWFPWSRVTAAGIDPVAAAAGLAVVERWSAGERMFVALTRNPGQGRASRTNDGCPAPLNQERRRS